MKIGICARCTRRDNCRFRQKGTWVEDCEQFEEDRQRTREDRLAVATARRGRTGSANRH